MANNALDNLMTRLEPLTHGVAAAPALVRLRISGKAVASAAAGMRKAADAALHDTTKTADARQLNAANAALKHAKPAIAEYVDGAAGARDQLQRISVQVRDYLTPRDPDGARELRQAIMALPSQERLNVLETAAQGQDWDAVRAIAGAHPLLIRDIPPGFVGNLADTYMHAVAPELMAERDQLTEAVGVLDVMAQELQRLVGEFDNETTQALRSRVEALAAEVQ